MKHLPHTLQGLAPRIDIPAVAELKRIAPYIDHPFFRTDDAVWILVIGPESTSEEVYAEYRQRFDAMGYRTITHPEIIPPGTLTPAHYLASAVALCNFVVRLPGYTDWPPALVAVEVAERIGIDSMKFVP